MPRKGYDYAPARNNQADKMEISVRKASEDENAYNLITDLRSQSFTPTDKTVTPVTSIVGLSDEISGGQRFPTGSLTFGEITVDMSHVTLQQCHDDGEECVIQRKTYGNRITPAGGITLSSSLQWQIPASGTITNAALIAELGKYSVKWMGATIVYATTSAVLTFYQVSNAVSDSGNNLQSLKMASSPSGYSVVGVNTIAGAESAQTYNYRYNRDAASPAAYPSAAAQTGKLHIFEGLDQYLESNFDVLTEILPSDESVGIGEAYIPTATVNLQGKSTVRRKFGLPPAA